MKRGFTLIEIVIVVAIIGLLSGLAFSTFVSFNKSQSLDKDAETIVEILRQARSQTVSSKGASAYGVHFEGKSVTLFAGTVYSSGNPTNEIFDLATGDAVITPSLAGGGRDVVFKRLTGEAVQDGKITISSAAAGRSKIVTVYKTGLTNAANLAAAATGYVDPDGDAGLQAGNGTNGKAFQNWSLLNGVSGKYTGLNKGVRQPSVPNADPSIHHATSDFPYSNDFSMTSISGAAAVTGIKVWLYGWNDESAGHHFKISVYMGGAWQPEVALAGTSVNAWRSAAFSGTWTQADLDALKIRIKDDVDSQGGSYVAPADASGMYAEVTYNNS